MGFNIFRKFRKDDTVIDLSHLQKRGILKGKKETLDLTSNSTTVEGSPLGFLGSLASAESSETPEVSSVIEESDGKTKLRGILRDIKLKIDSTHNRIYKLSDRIDLLEKKIDRLERRSGVSS